MDRDALVELIAKTSYQQNALMEVTDDPDGKQVGEPFQVPWDQLPEADEELQGLWRKDAAALLTAITQAGMAVVPREPTRAMIEAANKNFDDAMTHNYGSGPSIGEEWAAMLAAAEKGETG